MQNEELRRAIESIKLRAPVEDVVRERVPGLKKRGAIWSACCPFHEEKTPSFTVDPRRGTWHCFGACGTGGDVISFVEKLDNLGFLDVLEILAARTGVELPRGKLSASAPDEERALDLLERAAEFYRRQIRTSEGQQAARYLRERRLSDATADAFSIGYAPASGQAFVQEAREGGLDLALAEKVGLVRRNDQGRPYDFFRGRMIIPIRDIKGRAVGFGARRLSDEDAQGPKYVNTQDTPWFHKGRLVYALDRALGVVRKSGHIVLVEGYTDVMAAHQAGVANVVAVLGTATTDEHAGLIRKTGARRISLVFDGDEAGRKASYKALHGLLPLEVEIDVVTLPGGTDPCDLLTREGAAPFQAELEHARGWFDFVVEGLRGLSGADLAREVDRVLELCARLAKPVHRDSLMRDLARAIDLPFASVREQWEGRRGRREPETLQRAARGATAATTRTSPIDERRRVAAFEDLVGALLCDASLVPLALPFAQQCPDLELVHVIEVVSALYDDEDALIEPASVINALGEHPARHRVVPLHTRAASAESPRALLEGQLKYLRQRQLELERRDLEGLLREQERSALEAGGASAAVSSEEAIELSRRLYENRERLGELRTAAGEHSPVQTETRTHHG